MTETKECTVHKSKKQPYTYMARVNEAGDRWVSLCVEGSIQLDAGETVEACTFVPVAITPLGDTA